MWYEELLMSLTSKVFHHKRKAARYFIEKLFLFLDTLYQPLPIELLLGVNEKMYAKYGLRRNNSVHLAAFTRDLLGLSILYIKITDDHLIKNTIFIDFINQERMFAALNFGNDKRFARKAPLARINLIERIILKKFTVIDTSNPLHKNSLEVDLAHILMIVTQRKSLQLIEAMLNSFQPFIPICYPYIEKDDKFGHFVIELYRLKNQLEMEAITKGYEADRESSCSFFAFGNPFERVHYIAPSESPSPVKDYDPMFYGCPSTLATGGRAASTTSQFSFFAMDDVLSKSQQKEAVEDDRELPDISPPPPYLSLFAPSKAKPHCAEKIHTTRNKDEEGNDTRLTPNQEL